MPKPLTSAPPGTPRYAGYADQESAVTDAVGFAPSLLPRPGAVAITVTTTSALDRVSGVVCGDACVLLLGKCALKFVRHLHTALGKTHDGIES